MDQWWIRIFDFPHVQLTTLTLIAICTYFIKFDIKTYHDYAFVIVMIGCFIFQGTKIYPYTTLSEVEVGQSNITKGRDLRVYTANVLQKNKNTKAILSEINEHNPDIILLMETNTRWKNEVHPTLSSEYPFQVLHPLDNTYGILLYSKLELLQPELRFLVDKEIPSIASKIKLRSGDVVQFYAIHPTPPMPQHNPQSSDRDTEMMTTAFQCKKNNDSDIPTIVMGDFNDVAWSATTSLFRKVSGLLDPRIGRGFYNTFNAKNRLMRWPLDHLFVSPHFRIETLKTGENIGSDHFATFSILSFEPERSEAQQPEKPTKRELKRAKEQLENNNLLPNISL